MSNECEPSDIKSELDPEKGLFVALHIIAGMLELFGCSVIVGNEVMEVGGVDCVGIVIIDSDEETIEMLVPAAAGQEFGDLFEAFLDMTDS